MSLTLNGRNILGGNVKFPLSGAWMSTVEVEGADELAAECSLSLDETQLSGHLLWSHEYGSRRGVRIIGGKGGLSKPLLPQSYRGVPLALPLGDVMRQSGEVLAEGIESSITNYVLATWVVGAWTAGNALADLAAQIGTTWRVLDDGTIFLGNPTWAAFEFDHEVVNKHPTIAVVELAPKALTLRPGVTLDGDRISGVTYRLEPTGIRAIAEILSE